MEGSRVRSVPFCRLLCACFGNSHSALVDTSRHSEQTAIGERRCRDGSTARLDIAHMVWACGRVAVSMTAPKKSSWDSNERGAWHAAELTAEDRLLLPMALT